MLKFSVWAMPIKAEHLSATSSHINTHSPDQQDSHNAILTQEIIMGCQSCPKSDFTAELEVNGQKIKINPFVEAFISNAVTGMVASLNGVETIESIDLKIRRKS